MIYADYSQEPKDIFENLTEEMYASLYEEEMNNFRDDLAFFINFLQKTDTILEVGCGTGRISSILMNMGHQITGLDYSAPMLDKAKQKNPFLHTVKADFTSANLQQKFDKIIAPYNFLNLFTGSTINKVLETCQKHLKDNSQLLCEINCLDKSSNLVKNGSSFQFQIIDHQNGRTIKEIKRKYNQSTDTIEVEERYRLRPKDGSKKDLNHKFTVNGYTFSRWNDILLDNNFEIKNYYPDYSLEETAIKSRLLAVIEPKG